MQDERPERSPRYRRVPQQSRSRERVERILDTATSQVLTDGVDALSTRGIAEAAKVPVASLYQYFADKDDILLALVERDIEQLNEQVAAQLAALETVSVESVVATTMRVFAEGYAARPAFIMIWLRGRTNQTIRDYCREYHRQVGGDLFRLADGLGLLDGSADPYHAQIAVEMGDRLFQLAFEDDVSGDPLILDEAVRVVSGYADGFASEAGRLGVPS